MPLASGGGRRPGAAGCALVGGGGCRVRWGKRQGETVGLAGSVRAFEREKP
jgi:hypothetical protein